MLTHVHWRPQAEKALKRFSLFGAGSKYEDAGEAFVRAGNAYKVSKCCECCCDCVATPSRWHSCCALDRSMLTGCDLSCLTSSGEKAAEAYKKAAEMDVKTDNAHEAATHTLEAAKALKRVNVAEAIELYLTVVTQYEELGKFSAAAKLEKEIAEMCESEGETEECIKHYQRAADLFSAENAASSANGCLLKVGHFQALAENYEEAITVFEEVGSAFVENDMMKFKARVVFLQAGLCHLASGDPVAAERAITRYREIDYTFADSRESKFLGAVHEAYVAFDVDKFTDEVASYDSISKLSPWMTTILLRIKTAMAAAGEEAVDLS